MPEASKTHGASLVDSPKASSGSKSQTTPLSPLQAQVQEAHAQARGDYLSVRDALERYVTKHRAQLEGADGVDFPEMFHEVARLVPNVSDERIILQELSRAYKNHVLNVEPSGRVRAGQAAK